MTSETLELRVEDRLVSHSWCMCVVSHGYGGFGGDRDGGGRRYACGAKLMGFVVCQEMPEHFPGTRCYVDDTYGIAVPGHTCCRSSWKGLTTGCHEKAVVCCPCSWLATFHGDPWTQ